MQASNPIDAVVTCQVTRLEEEGVFPRELRSLPLAVLSRLRSLPLAVPSQLRSLPLAVLSRLRSLPLAVLSRLRSLPLAVLSQLRSLLIAVLPDPHDARGNTRNRAITRLVQV